MNEVQEHDCYHHKLFVWQSILEIRNTNVYVLMDYKGLFSSEDLIKFTFLSLYYLTPITAGQFNPGSCLDPNIIYADVLPTSHS